MRPTSAIACVRFALCLFVLASFVQSATAARLPRIEAVFELGQIAGNPYDFSENDVKVSLRTPDKSTLLLPAFFDGQRWRIRHSPQTAGHYEITSVSRNGSTVKPTSIAPNTFDVAGSDNPGIVRIDPNNNMRFIHEDGSLYYPIGFNHAWRNKGEPPKPTIESTIERMSGVGANWVRIWMDHWDMKNLDWIEDRVLPLGTLDQGVAKNWDSILEAAEKHGVYVQLALQHHGQFSTRADANWQINPWNKANGGWLETSADFFTDAKAKALTKAKYRYIIARYGCSPAIMAWELFNEVEGTDLYQSSPEIVAAWHAEMAAFLREQDPYQHLITTSSRTSDTKLYAAMDYYNPHVYAPDILTAIQTLEGENFDRPYFYGEIGLAAFGSQPNPGQTIHECLWGSLMSQSSGAAQYWYWDLIEDNDLFWEYAAATQFLKASKLLHQPNLMPLEVVVQTPNLAALRFGPGIGWAQSRNTQFTARPSGVVENAGGMSAFLQGTLNEKNKAMFPFMELNVTFPEPGTFSVAVDEITPDGAILNLAVDGKPSSSLTLLAPPAGPPRQGERQRPNPRVNATLSIPVAAGEHVIRLENSGRDWAHLRQFTLEPYAAQLAVLGKGSSRFAALWVYRREPGEAPIDGTIAVPGLDTGTYQITWFDTQSGKVIKSEAVRLQESLLRIAVGSVQSDVALWIAPTTDSPTTQPAR